MGSRTWIKVYCDKWINGTLRDEPIEVRGIWIDLLALVGCNPNSDAGTLMLTKDMGWSDNQIAKAMRVDIKSWLTAKNQLIRSDRISVDDDNVITIINWSKYQENYSRQARYRAKKKG